MRILKKIVKWLVYLTMPLVCYYITSLILSYIPVNNNDQGEHKNKVVYLHTNGVHLDIVIPSKNMSEELKKNLISPINTSYYSFGWGDENFYLNTPTWGDLTIKNAFKALFMKSTTLIHVTNYSQKNKAWVKVSVSASEMRMLNDYLLNSFKLDDGGTKILVANKGYGLNDEFYKAKGSYSCFTTCNTWANSAFKESGLKACLWTPFDFGLLNKYE